jgi:hypothetical protein
MRSLFFAASALALLAGSPSAFASQACSGDFRNVGGAAIADPDCERSSAEAVAADEHLKIVRNPVGPHQISREQFCRGNEDIRTDYYCAPYKD